MRPPARLPACLLALALLCAPARSGAERIDELPPKVAAALEGVVSVRVREVAKLPTFRNGRFHLEEVEGFGAGSGVVVSGSGLMLTNAHVVAGSAEVQVGFASGREAQARLLALDEASDLALLKIYGKGFRPIRFARAGPAAHGGDAFLVGNREGRGQQIARAHIGAHARVRAGARSIEFWSEVEAAAGPGDSGGALLNADGELIGIPSLQIHVAKDSAPPPPDSACLFIPARHVLRAYYRLREDPPVAWSWLGLQLEDPLMAAREGTPWRDDTGARVRRVLPGSPAVEAGFEPGDRIIAIGSRRVRDLFEALDAVLDLDVGTGVPVRVERGGRTLVVGVVTGPRPVDPRPDPLDDFTLHTGLRLEPRSGSHSGREGIVFVSMSEDARLEMPRVEADLFAEGPLLASILPGGDLLRGSTRRVPVASAEDLAALLPRCFVEEQFVALIHWSLGPSRTLDRAHVHRKLYPAII